MSFCSILGIWCAVLSGPAIVSDGDTIRVQNQAIRLQGIDAEELKEPNGPGARQALIRYTVGKIVECSDTGERSYNRIVGVCKINGQDLGAIMVKTGYALDCERYSKGRYRSLEPADIRKRLTQKPYC